MISLTDKQFANFIVEYPLYSKILFCDNLEKGYKMDISYYIETKAYKFYCPQDKDHHTFKFDRNGGYSILLQDNNISTTYLDNENRLNISSHFKSTCQICGFKMDLLLNIFSEENINQLPKLYLKKVGQLPSFSINPEKEILNYLIEEDKENYKKALTNLSISYGIGAFAYFRRIIENEIKRLVKDISELEYEDADKVKIAWEKYKLDHQMSSLIESVNSFLPKSLYEGGQNPIKVLYQQTSEGLHQLSDGVCLEKARHIDKILCYLIKKVNSLKFEYLEVKDAIKSLTK